jgi:hypothetical protein
MGGRGRWAEYTGRGAGFNGSAALVSILFLVDSRSHPWVARVSVAGELLVGLGILVGALVGLAAFFDASMNMSFLMADVVSTNPVLFSAAVLLILAWKNAGYSGADRFLLLMLGTPWRQLKLSRITQSRGDSETCLSRLTRESSG